ncbi:MAG: hypothetical protein ACRCZO_16195 [Cetobacterium sp.]
MSLATDILKRASLDLAPKPPKQKRTNYIERAVKIKPGPRKRKVKQPTVIYEAPPYEPVKGVSFNAAVNGWDAYFSDGTKTVRIGMFPTQARAAVARKIYLHWRKRGMQNIPNKPDSRLYTKWVR